MGLSDIRIDGIIAAFPERWRPYALLMRLDRPAGWWLLLLPGWWGIARAAGGWTGMGAREAWLMALFLAGAIVMRGAGCVINDLLDRDLDRLVERTRNRPIASGAISPRRALIFLAALLTIGFCILLQTTPLCILIGILSILPIAVYPLMKRITWWPQAFLGMTFNLGALMGWAAVMGTLEPAAFALYAAGIFWTLGYDTIYAHQDMDDDIEAGIRSTASLFGTRSKIWVGGFYAATIACLMILASGTAWSALILFLAAAHLAWQIGRWNPGDAQRSLRIFRSNRDFGLIVLAALLV